VQDSDDGSVGGENSKANGCDHGSEEKNGHKKRDHDRPTSVKLSFAEAPNPPARFLKSFRGFFNLTALTLRAVDD
jgi:hypothetical protein